jgi:hypothetical protein
MNQQTAGSFIRAGAVALHLGTELLPVVGEFAKSIEFLSFLDLIPSRVIRQYSSTAKSVTAKQNREKVSLRTERLFVIIIGP